MMDDFSNRIYDHDVPKIQLVTGRCDKCGDTLEYGEEGWNGEDGEFHFPYFDAGGGELERRECGPVYRIKKF